MHFHENFQNFHGEIEDFAESSACDLSYCSYKNYDFLNYNGKFFFIKKCVYTTFAYLL